MAASAAKTTVQHLARLGREQYPSETVSKAARLLEMGTHTLERMLDGSYDRHLKTDLSDPSRNAILPTKAGAIVRLAEKCGEDPTAWLEKLGFPEWVVPLGKPSRWSTSQQASPVVPAAANVADLMVTKPLLEKLGQVIDIVGPLSLEQAIALLKQMKASG